MKCDVSISPYKSFYKSAIAISFDYETSANSNRPGFKSRIYAKSLNIQNKFLKCKRNLSWGYGRGFANRHGTENIIKIFQKYDIHGTWFSTGHVLLKENFNKNAFRINQTLPYASKDAGFPSTINWRQNLPTFFYEPYSNFKRFPYWYLGDQAEKLRLLGEDIQCHTISHPFIPLETVENIRIDIEDWQNLAERYSFKKANIFAFPFLGDVYKNYYNIGLKTQVGFNIENEDYQICKLNDEVLDVFEENGIELLCRCISKNNEKYKAGFATYEKSKMFYMSEMGIIQNTFNFALFKNKIDDCIDNECAINIWMHPNNVFTKSEITNFEKMISYLVTKEKNNKVWIATISDILEHYKKVMSCELKLKLINEDLYEVVIHNKNASPIEDLGVTINARDFEIVHQTSNLIVDNPKVKIKKILANDNYNFRIKIQKK